MADDKWFFAVLVRFLNRVGEIVGNAAAAERGVDAAGCAVVMAQRRYDHAIATRLKE